MRARRISLAVFALLLLLVPAWGAAKEVPYLTGRVVDEAHLFSPEQRQGIEAKLEDFERRTTNQVAVLTVNSLEGEDIEGYAHKVASTWKLGQKGKDNGVLLLVAKNDRKMRLEVGYGLEPVLTDLQTSVIQNEVIIPHFRQNDFGGGIEAGVDAILSTIEGKEVQPAPVQQPPSGGRVGRDLGFLPFLLLLLVPFSLDAIRSRSWLMYLFLMPFYFFLGFIISPILGVIATGLWAVLFPILRMVVPKSSSRRRGGGGFLGPWLGGGGGGWSSGGGGWSGGGGFSGGGGSFGGGGSSSSW